jgi:hypothetical protein
MQYCLCRLVCSGDQGLLLDILGGGVSHLTMLGLIIVSLKFELSITLWYN